MDFAFNEEQDLLRRQARDFLDRTSPIAEVRRLMADPVGHDPAAWKKMADLGWTAVPFAEEYGGVGLGLVDLTVVLEELGRHLTPSPLQSSVGLAGMTLRASGDSALQAELLPGIADGSRVATAAVLEESGRWSPDAVQLTATRSGDAYVLRGTKWFVPDAHVADTMLVAARTGGGRAGAGLSVFAVDRATPGLEVRPLKTMDQTQRLFQVVLDDVELPADRLVGEEGQGWPALRDGIDAASVMVCAELCGVLDRVLEMSVAYAKERHQFGRPIGSYQAVSHKCADMLVLAESSKSLTYHAAWAVDSGAPEAALAVSMAKAYTSDAARTAAGLNIQVHGGIGFTWEHDAHLYFKRAKWGETVYGDARQHRERVAQLLEL